MNHLEDLGVCCVQPAYNSGHIKESKEAMKRVTFSDVEFVVSPSGFIRLLN